FPSGGVGVPRRDGRRVVACEKVCGVPVDSYAARRAQVLAGEAAGEEADCFESRFARGLCVVGRVADDDDTGSRRIAEERERGLEDVWVRLRLLGIVLRGLFFDEVFYICDLFVSLQLVGFGRRGEGDALAVSLDSLEQFAHAWEGAHARHVLALV